MGSCGGEVNEVSIQYVRELAVALRTQNLDEVKKFYHRWESAMELDPMPDDKKLEIDMHMMTMELPALADLHTASQDWLAARGQVWDVRDINCTSGCNSGGCGTDDAAETGETQAVGETTDAS
jgi:hypothetical protein